MDVIILQKMVEACDVSHTWNLHMIQPAMPTVGLVFCYKFISREGVNKWEKVDFIGHPAMLKWSYEIGPVRRSFHTSVRPSMTHFSQKLRGGFS